MSKADRNGSTAYADVEASSELLDSVVGDDDDFPAKRIPWLLANAKMLLLVAVVIQNAGYSLLRSYAGAIRHSQASTPSILATQELIKLTVSAYVMTRDSATWSGIEAKQGSKLGFVFQHSLKMIVPATMYLIMNILGFIALRHISAGMFAVIQQCKLVFTAVLSRVMLNREIAWSRWRSLLLLAAGVMLITLETTRAATGPAPHDGAAAPDAVEAQESRSHSVAIGIGAVLLEACLSGFANVYFEGVIKSTPLSIWHRNIQLSCWSLAIFVPMAFLHANGNGNPFFGWDGLAVGNALIGALGGILVALCIAYFDSIAKSVAVTCSVVVTCVFGKLLLNGPMSAQIVLGSTVVVISTISYSFGS
ncbi:nucleotide-sugar transporter-domain-containing protein [Pavlovales sp. CCMP2436]|nr:nucleotide-sugar transporter-domain-containing protein [Pavlovales sp. CCMP2436]|mmetsp:Transcript_35707/g.83900  ORF Transcript_35707/g.83900 Transcript_35707/m.83900 type:complete len:364 (-) Transcript_35707:80-1171(-)